MKSLLKSIYFFIMAALVFTGCKKDEDRAYYLGGTVPKLESSSNAVHMQPSDSVKTVVTFKWSDPAFMFSTGRSALDVIHTLDIGLGGTNFEEKVSFTLENVLQETSTKMLVKPFTGDEFNDILLSLGLEPEVPGTIDVRVSSAIYWQPSALTSEVITLDVTPYSSKPKPKYDPPARLFIVGSATPKDWTNDASIIPDQEFVKLDETTFALIIPLIGEREYLLIPEAGSWAKYASDDNTSEEGRWSGPFRPEAPHNFRSPLTSGLYKIVVDFITGTYTLTEAEVPENLYIVGSATPKDWTNDASIIPDQQFTKVNALTFEITIQLNGGGEYLLIPVAGNWAKYSVDAQTEESKMGGKFRAEAPFNMKAPDESGLYKIVVNFASETYQLTKL